MAALLVCCSHAALSSSSCSLPLPCPSPRPSARLVLAASRSPAPQKSPPPKVPRGNGLKKPLDISPALQQFLGSPQASRADTMKLVWDYIKSHQLQSESDRRLIVCDENLKNLLGKEQFNFLELAKLLSPHFLKST